jgi:hypothetical protein
MAAPATQVKCPHCDWKGSARGLFGHVRFVHPGKENSVKTNLRAQRNPYSLERGPALSGIQNQRKASNKPVNDISLETVGIALLVGTVLKLIEQYYRTREQQKKAREEFMRKFQREAQKPTNTQGVVY